MPDSLFLSPSPGAASPPPALPEVFGSGASPRQTVARQTVPRQAVPRQAVPQQTVPSPPLPFPLPLPFPADPTPARTAFRSTRPAPLRPTPFRLPEETFPVSPGNGSDRGSPREDRRGDRRKDPREVPWGLPLLVGRLTEISGSGASGVLSCALGLVAEAQRNETRYGPPAWVGSTGSLFFPPDAVRAGVSPERLVLLRLPSPAARFHAATSLVRSGAFGLVVVDLADPGRAPAGLTGEGSPFRSGGGIPPLARLAGLARKKRSAVVTLTEKPPTAPSLDPRVLGRYDASHAEDGLLLTVVKDKRRGDDPLSHPPLPPGFRFSEECDVPSGMC